MAYLFWEVGQRLRLAALTEGEQFEFPVSQVILADSLGLSTVHVNRTLQRLRKLGVLAFAGRRVSVLDPEALRSLAGAAEVRLHMRGIPDRLKERVAAP
jgi:biotin operon repressor